MTGWSQNISRKHRPIALVGVELSDTRDQIISDFYNVCLLFYDYTMMMVSTVLLRILM